MSIEHSDFFGWKPKTFHSSTMKKSWVLCLSCNKIEDVGWDAQQKHGYPNFFLFFSKINGLDELSSKWKGILEQRSWILKVEFWLVKGIILYGIDSCTFIDTHDLIS